jgi:hypothetical protein
VAANSVQAEAGHYGGGAQADFGQGEKNAERRAFYELAWHVGASQSDLAQLHADDIDWQKKIISYARMKLAGRGKLLPQVPIGPELEKLLTALKSDGYLFPHLRSDSQRSSLLFATRHLIVEVPVAWINPSTNVVIT